MKHLKLFESKDKLYHIAIYVPTTSDISYTLNNVETFLFETQEDCENFILDNINSELEVRPKKPDLGKYGQIDEDGNPFFTNYHDAVIWQSGEEVDGVWQIYGREVVKNVKLPDKVRIHIDANKYNL